MHTQSNAFEANRASLTHARNNATTRGDIKPHYITTNEYNLQSAHTHRQPHKQSIANMQMSADAINAERARANMGTTIKRTLIYTSAPTN